MAKVTLVCSSTIYRSLLDEEIFFYWLKRIPSIKEYYGKGADLILCFESAAIPDEDLIELRALFSRYEINMGQLSVFASEEKTTWLVQNSIAQLDELWEKSFGNVYCHAAMFKYYFRDRWVRIHSLPDGKRYPETEKEYQEILSRHNHVLSHLAYKDTTLFLVVTNYSSDEEPSGLSKKLLMFIQEPSYWKTIAMHSIDEKDEEFFSYGHLYAAKVAWQPGCFDTLLRAVADDETNNVMIIHPEAGWIFHPYDGGADIIVRSDIESVRLQSRFMSWLPSRPRWAEEDDQ